MAPRGLRFWKSAHRSSNLASVHTSAIFVVDALQLSRNDAVLDVLQQIIEIPPRQLKPLPYLLFVDAAVFRRQVGGIFEDALAQFDFAAKLFEPMGHPGNNAVVMHEQGLSFSNHSVFSFPTKMPAYTAPSIR